MTDGFIVEEKGENAIAAPASMQDYDRDYDEMEELERKLPDFSILRLQAFPYFYPAPSAVQSAFLPEIRLQYAMRYDSGN